VEDTNTTALIEPGVEHREQEQAKAPMRLVRACSGGSQTKAAGKEIRSGRVEIFRESSRKALESLSGGRANLMQPFPPERAMHTSVRQNADRKENCDLTVGQSAVSGTVG